MQPVRRQLDVALNNMAHEFELMLAEHQRNIVDVGLKVLEFPVPSMRSICYVEWAKAHNHPVSLVCEGWVKVALSHKHLT